MSIRKQQDTTTNIVLGILLLLFIFIISIKSCNAQITDSRDSQTYDTLTIGTQTWFTQNLNYDIDSLSWCYMNDTSACTDLGRLYDYTVVDSVCPTGYSVPTDAQWQILESYVGMKTSDTSKIGYRESGQVGYKLKAKSGLNYEQVWQYSGGGSDVYDFAVLGGGLRSAGKFEGYLYSTAFWTATESPTKDYFAYYRNFYNDFDGIGRHTGTKSNGYYIRCIKD